MAACPDRISCIWNAADAIDAFDYARRPISMSNVEASDIQEVLGEQRNRLFRVLGYTAVGQEVRVSIIDTTRAALKLRNYAEPPFEGWYQVESIPRPQVLQHGDVAYALIHAAMTVNTSAVL